MTDARDDDNQEFLERLTADEAAALGALCVRRSYERGSVLFREGDPSEEILIVRSGRVKVCARRANREVILAVLDAGSLLGELSVVDGEPRSATVEALVPVEVDVTSYEDFSGFVDAYPRVATELLRLVARRVRGASLRQLEFGTLDTLGRLCNGLTELADRYGTPNGEGTEIVAPFHQAELAAWSGMSREAVVKGLRQMRGFGWMSLDGRTITLHDPAAIRRRGSRH